MNRSGLPSRAPRGALQATRASARLPVIASNRNVTWTRIVSVWALPLANARAMLKPSAAVAAMAGPRAVKIPAGQGGGRGGRSVLFGLRCGAWAADGEQAVTARGRPAKREKQTPLGAGPQGGRLPLGAGARGRCRLPR